MYSTKSLTEKFRKKEFNSVGQFDKCECCGHLNNPKSSVCVKYYDRYKLILCDRCVDNKDGSTPWTNKYAEEMGLPPYPQTTI